MTDNRTTELMKLLDERGEHYVHDGHCVTWSYYTDPHTATESMDGTLIVTGLTPEQAIAATLGIDREIELQAALNKATGNWAKADALARDMWREMTICPDYPNPPCMTDSICKRFGKLERGELGSGTCEHDFDNYDEKNIEYILGKLGSGTCSMEYGGDITPDTAKVMGVYFCSECGSPIYNDCMPYYCEYCGKKVER